MSTSWHCRAALTATCKSLQSLGLSNPHLWPDLQLAVRVDRLPALARWLATRAAGLRALSLHVLAPRTLISRQWDGAHMEDVLELLLELCESLKGGLLGNLLSPV